MPARVLLAAVFLVAAGCSPAPAMDAGADARSGAAFPALSDDAVWRRISGTTPHLPAWARSMADTLPATTAHQINLDFAQRSQNPLGPVLSAEIRWIVADAHGCEYAKRCAASDLVRANVPAARIGTLADVGAAPEADREALKFAKRLTLDSSSITDDEVAALIASCGADDAVAVVHTTAYANFEDRLLLALSLTSDDDAAILPQEVRPPAMGALEAPPRTAPEPASPRASDARAESVWRDHSFDELRDLLGQQRARSSRIAPPDETRLARLPRPLRSRMGAIAWGTVSRGYQPELTKAWFRTIETFETEANLDRVFASSVLWVVNRTTDCYYCMGHNEMLLRTGGLSEDGARQRVARLAEGEWADFPPSEREAFRFARRMTADPSSVTREDVQALTNALGRARALDVVWQVAAGNYLMRVANAFQLRLETENVFAELKRAK